jgi:hypothetical protein
MGIYRDIIYPHFQIFFSRSPREKQFYVKEKLHWMMGQRADCLYGTSLSARSSLDNGFQYGLTITFPHDHRMLTNLIHDHLRWDEKRINRNVIIQVWVSLATADSGRLHQTPRTSIFVHTK